MGNPFTIRSLIVNPSVLTEARTLTNRDSGRTFFLNAAAGFTVTLPTPPMGGVSFEFIVKTAPTGDYVIACGASTSVIVGQIISTDQNAGSEPMFVTTGVENLKLKANLAKVGDSIRVMSDGTYWYATGFCALYDAILMVEESKSPSVSPSVSVSVSTSLSPSISVSLSPSVSVSISPSASPSVSVSTSPSVSVSLSPSISPSISVSVSPSV